MSSNATKRPHSPPSASSGSSSSATLSKSPSVVAVGRDSLQPGAADPLCLEWTDVVFDLIRGIGDPEKPESLEDLRVVREDLVEVTRRGTQSPGKPPKFAVKVGIVPTVPHCSLATLIGLCVRTQLERSLPPTEFKISLYIQAGSHGSHEEISKQINDKERVSAASEHPNLRETVMKCLQRAEEG